MTTIMNEKDFISTGDFSDKEEGYVKWQAPSNIALVKYWGKLPVQIPTNASLSFTLKNCSTITSVAYKAKKIRGEKCSFDLLFNGNSKKSFEPKIATFLNRALPFLPFLNKYHLEIDTVNSFPHGSGIASSASGMAALALCLVDMEKTLNSNLNTHFIHRKASFLARLGSGSASRSIQGPIIHWGVHSAVEQSSNLYGIPYPYKVHGVFTNYQDTILVVQKGRKNVSSTLGHDLMKNHPLAKARFRQADEHISKLKRVLEKGDLLEFIEIIESEALSLHAMMMTSKPYFMLMKPNTLEIIQEIWDFRTKTDIPICFTLDAGANVHLLYPEKDKNSILKFIRQKLVVFCENGHYICDEMGSGAKKIG